VDTSQPVTLPPFATIVQTSPPPNPSAPIFAGWLQSNGQPMTQAVKLEQMAGECSIPSDDHSYADNKTDEDTVPQRVNVPCSSEHISQSSALCNLLQCLDSADVWLIVQPVNKSSLVINRYFIFAQRREALEKKSQIW